MSNDSNDKNLKIGPQLKFPKIPPLTLKLEPEDIKNEKISFLLFIKSNLMELYFEDQSLVDKNIIRMLAKILWEFEFWSHDKQTEIVLDSCEEQTEIILDSHENILYDQIKYVLDTYPSSPELFENLITKKSVWNVLAYIYNSAIFWTKSSGRKGYIKYLKKYIPFILEIPFIDNNRDLISKQYIHNLIRAKLVSRKQKEYRKSHYSKYEIRGYLALAASIFNDFELFDNIPYQSNNYKLSEIQTKYILDLIECLKYVLNTLPPYVELHSLLIYAECVLKRYKRAENYYFQAIKKLKGNYEIYDVGGKMYFKTREYGESINCYRKIFNKSKDTRFLYVIGCSYYNLKDFKSAVVCFKKMKKMDNCSPSLEKLLTQAQYLEKNKNSTIFKELNESKFEFLDDFLASIRDIYEFFFDGNPILCGALTSQ